MKVKNLSNNNMTQLNKMKSKTDKTTIEDKNGPELQGAQKGLKKESIKDSAKIDVSLAAQQMKKAKDLATPGDDIDHAKVARIQQLVDEGKYKVDAGAIADRLVENHLLFGE